MHLGFDIGGSRVKAVLVKNRKILKSLKAESPRNIPELLQLIKKLENELSAGVEPRKIRGVGFSFPGVIDKKREKILKSPNLRYLDNQPIKKILSKQLRRPIKIEHDVHCFLLAEKKIGAAKNLKDVFYLTLGTGIGGAFMIDGKIIFGSRGAAGEAGHTIMKFEIRNSKFETLTFEDLGGNKYIKKASGLDPLVAFKLAERGDKKSRKVFAELGINLGVGIANLINIFDPEAVILGGGITRLKNFILPGIKSGIKKFVISPQAKNTKIIVSKMSEFGGALGATLLFEK